MLVITDMEWVRNASGATWLTQLYAERVTDAWETVDSFDAIIRPPSITSFASDHVAFNGYAWEAFLRGEQEADALTRFASWLRDDDVICFWHQTSDELLRRKWPEFFGRKLEWQTHTLQHVVLSALGPDAQVIGNPYVIARVAGVDAPRPEHCAANDVCLVNRLCVHFGIGQEQVLTQKPEPLKPKPVLDLEARKRRNASIQQKMQCNYVYTPDSEIFHAKGCSTLTYAKTLQGCGHYLRASKFRRPCKLCKPQPDSSILPDEPKPPVLIRSQTSERIEARLFTGEHVVLKRGRIVGCCHNNIHPGKMTKGLLKQHDCLGKQCRFFEKYEDSPYWENDRNRKKEREKAKQKKKEQRAAAIAEEESLRSIGDALRECIPEEEDHLEIIRVERVSATVITVFYVSDNRFADGNRFPTFLETAQRNHPAWHLRLRHIKDLDGHFVTRDEFRSRKR